MLRFVMAVHYTSLRRQITRRATQAWPDKDTLLSYSDDQTFLDGEEEIT